MHQVSVPRAAAGSTGSDDIWLAQKVYLVPFEGFFLEMPPFFIIFLWALFQMDMWNKSCVFVKHSIWHDWLPKSPARQIFINRPVAAMVKRAVQRCSTLSCFLSVLSVWRMMFTEAALRALSCVCACVCVQRKEPWMASSLIHNCHVALGLMGEKCLQLCTSTHKHACTYTDTHTHSYGYVKAHSRSWKLKWSRCSGLFLRVKTNEFL